MTREDAVANLADKIKAVYDSALWVGANPFTSIADVLVQFAAREPVLRPTR